ncbi:MULTISPECIES: hypothetical protein [Agrobacterium]|uniref:hypothetical protein n=1 Tax=Agrobacterium TaxID=357 RepID=UPI0009BC1CDD|nr:MULTISPECIES: hypothetical protein [Agrobacterium]QCL75636.1 hypothetical protein CFBP5499_19300 [Agrobacterium tumefaciens]CUX57270.1 hypothetical protein AGR6A_Lc140070 [Agrobacterium sp. NCPPB 925]
MTLNIKSTTIRKAKIGSLIRFDHDNSSYLAIVCEHASQTSRLVTIDLHKKSFRHGELSFDRDALDLGSNWLLEPANIAYRFVDGTEAVKQQGLLTFSETGEPVLSVYDHRQHNDLTFFNLRSGEPERAVQHVGTATEHWVLWASELDRNGTHREPLFVSPILGEPNGKN